MSNIDTEPRRRFIPWLLALGLLLLAIWGVAKAMERHPAATAHSRPGATSAQSRGDETPSPLRQYAAVHAAVHAAAHAAGTPAMRDAA
jgi:hypothetical protein